MSDATLAPSSALPALPATLDAEALRTEMTRFAERFAALGAALERQIVGQKEAVRQLVVAAIAQGHVLLEGVPGTGKTLLAQALARALDVRFARVQFTPDLMPGDITGSEMLVESGDGRRRLEFRPGPVFTNVLHADEVNRATPKTQSALLEAMQELAVTAGGVRHAIEPPFLVVATQNPIEMEGTYPLPEAQVDRFLFKVLVPTGDVEAMAEVLARTTGGAPPASAPVLDRAAFASMQSLAREVACARPVLRYAAALALATHPGEAGAPEDVRRFVRYGASARGAQALVLGAKVLALTAGRAYATPDDIRAVAHPALRHRIILGFEGEAQGVSPDRIVGAVLANVPEDPPEVARLLRER